MLKPVVTTLTAAFLMVSSSAALAVEIPPDARSMALQGGRAAPFDNGSLYLNPAGAALMPRYEVAAFGRLGTEGAPTHGFNLSILDSLTVGDLGGGVSWQRRTGNQRPQDDFVGAMAQRYGNSAVGVGVSYRMDRELDTNHFNFDVGGVFDELDGLLKVALVASNLLNPPEDGSREVQRNFALGLASGWPDLFEVTADLIWTPSAESDQQFAWSTGLEVMIGEYARIRGGYGELPAGPQRQGRWSVGAAGGDPGVWSLGYVFLKPVGSEPGTHGVTLSGYAFN